MKQTKKVFAYFVPFDTTGIQAFLEKQARKGWMLEKTGGAIWNFRRIEPKNVHFSVVFFPNASAFDPAPSEAQQSFFDFCEHTGWKLASSDGKRQIFYNEAADPTPIETDAALEVDTIHRAAKKDYLPSCLALLAILLMEFVSEFRLLFSNPLLVLSNNASVIIGIDTIVTAILLGIELGAYFLWYHRARAAAELPRLTTPITVPMTSSQPHTTDRMTVTVRFRLAENCFRFIQLETPRSRATTRPIPASIARNTRGAPTPATIHESTV